MEIITDSKILAEPAEQFAFMNLDTKQLETADITSTIDTLKQYFNENSQIIALSGPQIGIKKRIICIRFDNELRFFINPIITKKAKYTIVPETCASLPNKEILIARPEDITIVYYNEQLKYEENKLLGYAARIFDQQCQLLDGILPSDLGLVSDITVDGKLSDLSENDFNQAVELYKQYIKVKALKATEEATATTELATQYRTLDFSEKVINGQASIVVNDKKSKETSTKANNVADLSLKQLQQANKQINKARLEKFLKNK